MGHARAQDAGRLALAVRLVAADSAVCLATFFCVEHVQGSRAKSAGHCFINRSTFCHGLPFGCCWVALRGCERKSDLGSGQHLLVVGQPHLADAAGSAGVRRRSIRRLSSP